MSDNVYNCGTENAGSDLYYQIFCSSDMYKKIASICDIVRAGYADILYTFMPIFNFPKEGREVWVKNIEQMAENLYTEVESLIREIKNETSSYMPENSPYSLEKILPVIQENNKSIISAARIYAETSAGIEDTMVELSVVLANSFVRICEHISNGTIIFSLYKRHSEYLERYNYINNMVAAPVPKRNSNRSMKNLALIGSSLGMASVGLYFLLKGTK